MDMSSSEGSLSRSESTRPVRCPRPPRCKDRQPQDLMSGRSVLQIELEWQGHGRRPRSSPSTIMSPGPVRCAIKGQGQVTGPGWIDSPDHPRTARPGGRPTVRKGPGCGLRGGCRRDSLPTSRPNPTPVVRARWIDASSPSTVITGTFGSNCRLRASMINWSRGDRIGGSQHEGNVTRARSIRCSTHVRAMCS